MSTKTMKQWVIKKFTGSFDCLEQTNVPIPEAGENEVLVKFDAVSLNYRDLIIPLGTYPFPSKEPPVPTSDGAGVVVDVGSKVTQFKKGDHVVTMFFQGHQFGDINPVSHKTALGGFLDGCLQEYGAFNEQGLVHAPKNYSSVESSTITCAALTSWNSLYGLKPLKPGQTVLVQGTGGVSIFGLQFAKAAGATIIATTSSAAKGEKLKQLGADHVINYREDKNWGETARKLTPGGFGVDHVLEVGGPGTLEQSFKCVKMEGVINIIGAVGGAGSEAQPQVIDTLTNVCTVRGIQIGSKALMLDMIRAIEANNIRPVVDDKLFTLDEAREAYQYMWDQKHFGKLVIRI
ncbi:hypothetical protein FE257_005599 [Aspergillus nanangensis]|uniref:Enoyl reductase (ER) domain-containing protein n=1 Tax=Aspergillus nanangensis TaxID=2582783 RepID=A0AAD4CS14_ASPNN|nr:hypothetical protein FE257_005599 [Aspergillus nanangensis]